MVGGPGQCIGVKIQACVPAAWDTHCAMLGFNYRGYAGVFGPEGGGVYLQMMPRKYTLEYTTFRLL